MRAGQKVLIFGCGLQMILSIVCFALIVKDIRVGDNVNIYAMGLLCVCVLMSIVNTLFLLRNGNDNKG